MRSMFKCAFALLGATLVFAPITVIEAKEVRKEKTRGAIAGKIMVKPDTRALAQRLAKPKKLTEPELDHLLDRSPWPEELHEAVKRVAFCESSWIPAAKGPTGDHGLLQIRFKDHRQKIESQAKLYDPLINLRIGYEVYKEARRGKFKHGLAPWYMSNHCHKALPAHVANEITQFRIEKSKRRAMQYAQL